MQVFTAAQVLCYKSNYQNCAEFKSCPSRTCISEYREAFSLFDKDGNGQITVDELRAVLKTLGKNPTDEEVMEMINSVDENGKVS